LIVLRAVRIARPVDQDERLSVFLEHRQKDLGRGVGEVLLLREVRRFRPRRGVVAGWLLARRSPKLPGAVAAPRGTKLKRHRARRSMMIGTIKVPQAG